MARIHSYYAIGPLRRNVEGGRCSFLGQDGAPNEKFELEQKESTKSPSWKACAQALSIYANSVAREAEGGIELNSGFSTVRNYLSKGCEPRRGHLLLGPT